MDKRLENKLLSYENSLPVNRIQVFERNTANQKLKELFATANNLLTEQLDRLIPHFEKAKPDFYISYLSARKVVSYGIRYEKTDTVAPSV